MELRVLLFLLLMLLPTASAYTGIVVNNTQVMYKFDNTDTLPVLNPGEQLQLRDDIYDIPTDALYDKNTGIFTQPEVIAPEEMVTITATPSPIDPNILVLSGAGVASAYIIARRKKA